MPNPTPESVKNTMAHLRAVAEIMADFDAGKIDQAEARLRVTNAGKLYGRLQTFVAEVEQA